MNSVPNRKPHSIIHVPRRFAPVEWGGTESVLLNLCREQIKAGWNPKILTSKALDRKKRVVWNGISIHRHNYCYPFLGISDNEKLMLDKKGGNLISLCLFYSLLREKDVRIYHAHTLKRMGGTVATAARIKKKPCVVSVHGNVFDVPHEEYMSIIDPQRTHFEWGKPFGMLMGSRTLLEKADAVICVSQTEYEKAQKNLSHNRIYHIPNGVNPEKFQNGRREITRKKYTIPENAFVFGCISRIDPQKNQKLLLEAFIPIARKIYSSHLVISGPQTEPAYREQLERTVNSLGLTHKVSFVTQQEPESRSLADLFSTIDVFVLPSRHEPFGIVVLEAWSAGKPVIASSSGHLPKLIQDGVDGLIFESGNQDQLTHHMFTLLENPDLCHALAYAGSLKTPQYSWKSVAERFESIYCEAEDFFASKTRK